MEAEVRNPKMPSSQCQSKVSHPDVLTPYLNCNTILAFQSGRCLLALISLISTKEEHGTRAVLTHGNIKSSSGSRCLMKPHTIGPLFYARNLGRVSPVKLPVPASVAGEYTPYAKQVI